MARKVSEAERQERREGDRRRSQEAVQALLSGDGWKRWLAVRRHFHRYSLGNQLLIAMQLPAATRVAGFRAWLRLGYCVRRGERALRVWVPMPPSKAELEAWRDEGAVPEQKPRTRFRQGPVFDRSQVEPLPAPAEPVELDPPPVATVERDDLEWALEPLSALATACGSQVTVEELPADVGGYFDPFTRTIGLSCRRSVNHRVKTLVHELGHLLLHRGGEPSGFTYSEEELVVESVAFTVCGSLGLDTTGFSIPYLASWSEQGKLETVQRAAQVIDAIAKRIEDSVVVEGGE